MANTLTLARPYALAAFECALENKAIADWEGMLTAAADVARNKSVAQLLMDPLLTSKQLIALFSEVLTSVLDQEKKNFIALLAEKKRLPLLPEILELFKSFRAEREKIINVKLTTAIAIDKAMENKMAAALVKRLQQQILLECEVDPALVGGAIISAGDIVIDGSVQGQLKRLLESLSV